MAAQREAGWSGRAGGMEVSGRSRGSTRDGLPSIKSARARTSSRGMQRTASESDAGMRFTGSSAVDESPLGRPVR